jgi:hypothetical protein
MNPGLSRRLLPVCALGLPMLVWYLGVFFFRGELGKWIDDYGAHLRDPASGQIHWEEMVRPQWWFFWRPIHIQLIYILQTLFYSHDWANHLFGGVMHAGACAAFWWFLRVWGVRPVVAAGAALVMLGSVQGFEAILWPATVSTSIATAGFFCAAVLAVRHARGERPRRLVILLGVLGFVIPCLYEQPAAALAALPIVYLAAARGAGRAWVESIRGVFVALAPCALALIAYLALFILTVRMDPMSREAQFSDGELMRSHARYLVTTIAPLLLPWGGLRDLWDAGFGALQSSSLGMYGWAGLAGAAMGAWVWYWWSSIARSDGETGKGRWRGLWLVPFGVAALLLALVPIVCIRGAGISPRLTYFPLACALLGVAGIVDAIIGMVPRVERPARVLAAAACGLLALIGAVDLVGVQHHMRLRYAADQAFMRSLRQVIPNPSADTLLVPVVWAPDPDAPGQSRAAASFLPIWTSPWAITTEVKRVYGRNDVDAASSYGPTEAGAFLRIGDPSTIAWSHYFRHLPTPRKDTQSYSVPAWRIIPYAIDARGGVSLIPTVKTTAADGRSVRIDFPQALALAQRGAPAREVSLNIPLDTGRPWISDWEWTHRTNAVSPKARFQRITCWGASDVATRMHPPVPGVAISDGDTDEMAVDLPAETGTTPHRLVFYATFDESTIDLSVLGDGVDLTWSVDKTILKKVHLDPKDIKARRVWETIAIDIPVSSANRTLRVAVGAGPSGNPSYDRVVVTCGEEDLAATGAKITATGESVHTP